MKQVQWGIVLNKEIYGLVLAGGRGKRLGIEFPKCAIDLGGKSIIERVIENINKAGIKNIVCVLGYKKEIVEPLIPLDVKVCYQKDCLGTADAVLASEEKFSGNRSDVLIMAGDMPFISEKTIKGAYQEYLKEKLDLIVCSFEKKDPFGYGRIIRKDSEIVDIKEERDCNSIEKEIKEVNASVYIVDSEKLFHNIRKITNNNSQQEFYLTDVVSLFVKEGFKIGVYNIKDEKEMLGINKAEDLEKAKKYI